MTKARRAMQEDIKLIDLIIELVDARIPQSSRNPDIDDLGKNKARLVLLNKSDLADPVCNRAWTAWFQEQGIKALEINAQSGQGMKAIQGAVQGEDRTGQETGDTEPSGTCDGCRNSQCGEVYLY